MKADHGEISGRNWGWWDSTDVDGSDSCASNLVAQFSNVEMYV